MFKNIFFRLILVILLMMLLCFCAVTCIIFFYSQNLPTYSELANYNPPSVTRVYSADGKLLQEYAKERRVFVPIENIPSSLVQAFIAAEDKNFYHHPGIDFFGLIRAVLHNFNLLIQNKRIEGASTISQQVVKMFFLSPERSIQRKIKEAILSFKISKVYSKDKILELYLNQTFFGKGAYGVASAAKQYFNKSLEELDLAESALLAALPKFPSIFNSDNYTKITNRRNYVIRRMKEDGYISQEAADAEFSSPIALSKPMQKDRLKADGYVEQVRKKAIEILGSDAFYNDGFTIITPLNSEYQEQAKNSFLKTIRSYDTSRGFKGPIDHLRNTENWEIALKNYTKLPKLLEQKPAIILKIFQNKVQIGVLDLDNKPCKAYLDFTKTSWHKTFKQKNIFHVGDIIIVKEDKNIYNLSQIPDVDGALMMIEVKSGKVLAMITGYDENASKFNRATQALRQPGSLIKPFVYLAALENGLEPTTIIEDSPIEIYQGPNMPIYSPQNYGKTFMGPITLRTALEKSRNIATVQLAKMIGLGKIAEIIQRYNINQDPPKLYSMALGSLETTLSQITSAYGSIANGCSKIEPHFIELIKNKHGKIIYKRDIRKFQDRLDDEDMILPQVSDIVAQKILSDEASCYQIISLLQGSIERGTGSLARSLNKIIAGKTGTTNESMDAWFVGFTPKIVIGTFVGFDKPKTLGEKSTGATVALPMFVDLMSKSFNKDESLKFILPQSIQLDFINPKTGQKDIMQNGQPKILEAFKKYNSHEKINSQDPFYKLKKPNKFEDFDVY